MKKALFVALLAATAVLAEPPAAAQCTPGPHSGTIASDQTWCAADTPHVLTGVVTVAPGVTLTIEAGSTVKPAVITVQGHLSAVGTATSPITFTSDGPGWESLTFSGGTGLLRYVDVLKAGWNAPGIVVTNVAAPGVIFESCNLGPGNRGMSVTNAVVSITDSKIEGLASFAGAHPIVVSGADSRLTLANDSFLGNWANRVVIEAGAMTSADFTLASQSGLEAYVLGGGYEVPAGKVVTFGAGTTVIPGGHLTVRGRLATAGTEAAPVVIGSGTDWDGIFFEGGTGLLSHVRLLNAGHNSQGITVRNVAAPGVVLDHASLEQRSQGIAVVESALTVRDSSIETTRNGFYAIAVSGATSVLSVSSTAFSGTDDVARRILIAAGAMTNGDFTLAPQAGLEAFQLGGDYTIPAGRTVTVEAGTTVYQDGGLRVRGRLVTNGTAAAPITITNGWRWTGVTFEGGTGALAWTRITNAGFNSAALTATNVPLPGVVLDHASIGPGNDGIVSTDSVLVVRDSTFEVNLNGRYAIHVHGPASTLSLSNNTFGGAGDSARQIGLAVGAMTGADFTLVPQTGLEAWHLGSNYAIPAGRTMTIDAGATVYQDGGLHVLGRLVGNGTAAQPVTITHGYRWNGVYFDGGTGTLTWTRITNAGFNSAALTATNVPLPGVVLDHASIGPGSDGIESIDSALVVRDSTFEVNLSGRYAIHVQGPASTLSLSNNTFGGTGDRARRIGLAAGAMTAADATLVPQAGLEAWVLASGYAVPSGRTLAVEAGTPLVPTNPLVVHGRFVTRGTAARPVTIDGYRYTIDVDGGAGELVGAVVRDGGFNDPAVLVRSRGTLLLERTRLHNCNRVRAENAAVTIRNAAFLDGYRYALELDLASTLTAHHATIARSTQTAVVAEAGSTVSMTNSLFSSCPRGVWTDGTSTATLTNTLWDAVPTQASGGVTQRGFLVGPAAFAADGYHVGASSAALAQAVATNVADDLDGEARPRPAGLLADLGADESDGGALLPGRTATPIAIGQTRTATALSGAFADHVVTLVPGQAASLKVRVVAPSGTASFRLLVRQGQFPASTLFDGEGDAVDATARELLLPAPRAGDWYLSVLAAPADVPFTISVSGADRGVSTIAPTSGGNTGAVTVSVSGVGFEEEVRFELRNGGVALRSSAPSARTATRLTARVDLSGLAPQLCDACVVWPDGAAHCASGGFRIVAGSVSAVEARLSIPDVLRGGRGTTGVVSWVNVGNVDVEAPLLVVASDQNAPLRRTTREGWRRGALRFLAVDGDGWGTAGVLPPGARGRATFEVYSEGPAHAALTFTLHQLSDTAMAREIDWAALESSLRPEGIDTTAWSRVWPLIRQEAGTTWGDYASALRTNASYLSGLGRTVTDPALLFGVTVDRALSTGPVASLASGVDAVCPSPGPLLSFGRAFSNGPFGRATVGELGVGWTHTYDRVLATLSNGDREVRSNDGTVRLFRRLPDGSYRGTPGDHGRLVVEGPVARLVEPSGVALAFRADGQLASIADADGNRIDVTWSGTGRLAAVAHTNGDRFVFDHDGAGRLVRLTDHAGAVTAYGYDGAGRRLVQVTQPGGRITRYAYKGTEPDADALVSVTFPDGSHAYWAYDGNGRLVGHRRDTGPETSFTRDAAGRIVVGRGPASRAAASALAPPEGGLALALDEAGRLGAAIDPLGSTIGLEWDDEGGLAALVDPFGNVAGFEHGPLGEVTAYRAAGGLETRQSYTYPSTGGRFARSLTDPRGNVSSFAQDSAGRVTSVVWPGGGTETFQRDPRGLLLSYTNRRGQTVSWERNGRGQPTRKTLPDGTRIDYAYDAAGRLVSATDARGTTRLTWSPRGELSEVLFPDGKWFRYERDGAGRTTRRTSDDGYALEFTYDAAGRPVRVSRNGGTLVVSYEYDVLGRLSREVRGNGTATEYSWDAASRLASITHLAPGGATLASHAYTWDAAGRATSATGPDGTSTYEWDDDGLLVRERSPSGVLTTYSYDSSGNRVRAETNGVVVPYAVNALDQVTSAGPTTYSWDADGNLASRTTPAGTTTFDWDAERRLTAVAGPDGTASYTRDALGFVASQTLSGVASRFVNDPVAAAGAAATVLDAAGAIAGRFDHGASLAAALDAAGAASAYHFDAMGNTSVVSGPGGAASRTYAYDAHGNVTAATGSAPNPYTTGGSGSARTLPGGLVQGASSSVYDPAAGRLASTNVKGRSAGTNLYTPWKPMTLKPQGPPKTLGGKIDEGVQGLFWTKSFLGKLEPEPDDLGQFSPDALLEPAYNSVKGIVDATSASEQNDTLGTIEALGNSALADLELLSVAFPGLRPVTAGTKTIATVGKKACELYVANLAPNRDPYWFQPVPRNKWYYYRKNFDDGPIPPDALRLLERTGPKDQVFPGDPNAKDATAGAGPRHRVRAGSRIFYNVSFENVPSASAPAQEVFVTDVLDGSLDLSTLELHDAGWSSTAVAAPEAARSFRARTAVADHRPGDLRMWWVDVEAGESSPGRLAFTFRTLDPSTGELPTDPLAGFLPPNDATGRGKGWALFSVRTKPGLAPGTRITNAATIVFDTEAPITTNEVFHTIGLPGDVNDDGVVNPGDVFYLVAFLYSGGPPPPGIADANPDGKVDALDLFTLINHLFAGGPAPL